MTNAKQEMLIRLAAHVADVTNPNSGHLVSEFTVELHEFQRVAANVCRLAQRQERGPYRASYTLTLENLGTNGGEGA